MFDWNDEELTNIIWDEAEDSDNHIVPYPGTIEAYSRKREWTHEVSNNKLDEQKAPATEVAVHGQKPESTSNISNSEGTSTSGYHMDLWPDISLAKAAKTKQDSLQTSGSSLSEITKFDSSGVEAAEANKDIGIYQNPDEGEEQAGFGDYSWADIGSFDDLDRIFSNDDSIFGNVNLGNSEEPWSSSKEVPSSPEKSFPLPTESPSLKVEVPGVTSEHYGARTGYEQQEEQQFAPGYAGLTDHTSSAMSAHAIGKSAEYGGLESNITVNEQTDLKGQIRDTAVNSQLTVESAVMPNKLADKVHKHKKNLKGRKKMMQKSQLDSCPTAYHNWNTSGTPPGQFKDVVALPIVQSSPSVLRQQNQLGGPETIQYQQMQISSPFVTPSGYGNANLTSCSSTPVLSHAQSVEFKHQSLLPGHDVSTNQNSINTFNSSAGKGKMMTSQEKIEKLRRRQQMRAMLAIQKQQQQFVNHQVPCRDRSINKRAWEETQVQHSSGGADLVGAEDPSGLSTFELGSPLEQDDSSMISLSQKDYGTEESTLHQLKDIIAKLDVSIRLCIRDSLFRLAQSATLRHSVNDTRCTNISCKDELAVKQQATSSHDRSTKIPEEETKTNPIDRIVAHLLFHRPRELPGKLHDTPESPPVSSKTPLECKGVAEEQQMSFLPETPRDDQQILSGSRTSCLSADPNPTSCQTQNVTSSETSDNASNSGLGGEVGRGVETSI